MMRLRRLLLAGFGLLLAAAAPAADTPPASRLVITGSTTMAPLVTEIARRFQALHPGIQVDVQMGGSGRGIQDVREGRAAIGMVSRVLGKSERDLQAVAIARDGVAVIVHRDNPVAALTQHQLADIYSGRTAAWRQLGGTDAPIVALAGTQQGGSTEVLTQYLRLPYDQLQIRRAIGPNSERIAAVAADPQAMIWVSVSEAERRHREGVPIKLLTMDGVPATSRAVRDGDYPLSRPLMLVTSGRPSGMARDFIDFCLSSRVTDLVRGLDFVPYLD